MKLPSFSPIPGESYAEKRIRVDRELDYLFDITLSDVRFFAKHHKTFVLLDFREHFAFEWQEGREVVKYLLDNELIRQFKRGAQKHYTATDFLMKVFPEINVQFCSVCRSLWDHPTITITACRSCGNTDLTNKHPFQQKGQS